MQTSQLKFKNEADHALARALKIVVIPPECFVYILSGHYIDEDENHNLVFS